MKTKGALRVEAATELAVAMNKMASARRLLREAATSPQDLLLTERAQELWARVNSLYVEVLS